MSQIENHSINDVIEFYGGEGLQNHLENEAINHNHFHHYTNMNSLELILKNRTIKLTRGNSKSLNDWHEAEVKGDPLYWNKTYIGCFSFDDNKDSDTNNYDSENMAMWGLYGIPSEEAVRFSLSAEWMKKLIDFCKNNKEQNENIVYLDGKKRNPIKSDDIELISFADVFYVRGTNNDKVSPKQFHNSVKINFKFDDCDLHSMLKTWNFTGFVKNYAWHYEKESRIIVRLKDPIDQENIFLLIPKNVIKKFNIVLSPNYPRCEFANDNNCNNDCFLKNFTKKFSKYGIEANNVRRSLFDGLVHFKSGDKK